MTYPNGATPPSSTPSTHYPQYPPYPQYPAYPGTPAYPQYAPPPVMWAPPVQPPPPPLRPLEQPPRGFAPDRYARVGAIVAAVVVIVAVALASIAPLLVNHSSGAVPSSWAKIYDGQPTIGDGYWQAADGCRSTSQGLLVSEDANTTTAQQCYFTPSVSRDLTSQGFYFEAVTAPPADVSVEEDPVLAIGVGNDVLAVFFDQEGAFTMCTNPCEEGNGGVYSVGVAGSWHTNGFTQNTIALLYNATSQQVTAFVNGQEVSTVTYNAPASSRLRLSVASSTTSAKSAALFTHVRVFTGSITA